LIARPSFLLPPSVDDWLPEKHLARFVVEVIDGLAWNVKRMFALKAV
jgi:hypothetical protein